MINLVERICAKCGERFSYSCSRELCVSAFCNTDHRKRSTVASRACVQCKYMKVLMNGSAYCHHPSHYEVTKTYLHTRACSDFAAPRERRAIMTEPVTRERKTELVTESVTITEKTNREPGARHRHELIAAEL